MTTKISDETPSQEALLTEAEQRQILFEWNMTYRAYPKNLCLHQLFETQVERTPDAVALICEQEQFTYQQLNRQANQLAHYLQTLGVEPEVRVGICMKRSLELVVGLLGILKAGGVYVPLDPVYPHERLSFMLTDAQISVLLIQRQLLAQLPAHQAKLVCLDAGQQALSQQQENPISEINAENLAYVIYTSGSTGRPKGAMNTHQGVCNTLLWLQETNQLSQNDCLVHKTSLSFDLSVEELFWPLMTGARLVVAHPESYQESTYLLSLIKQYAITVLDLVPSILQMLLEEPDWPEGQSVRLVICGGETLSPELQKRFFASHRASLLNTYGPTEAAIDATFWHCGRNSKASTVPIGHPLANTQIYLLDKHLQPVPVGVPAELYIGGVNLARGYLNRADLTAERFVPHPFAGTVQGVGPGVRIYRTGDLARYRSDGTIEYLGRVDQQIKLRGFRIEPGEIESVLEQHPAVRQAVVVLSTESASDQRLVAYVVLHKDYQLPMSMLREHLAGQIPEYMVPSIFVQLEALPLTPNGKLDRRALPAPLHSERMITDAFVAPTLPLHHQLVHIWEDLLHVKPIGIKDNFFELGGHSLLATRLFDCIAQVFGKKLPLSTFVTDATIAYLTDVLMTIKISDETPSQEDLLNAPLVLAQEHIQIPAMVTDVLKELSCQEEAPLLLVLLAAFEVLLHRYTGQDDLVIGILPTDYPEMESEASTSPFARPHILRTDLSGDPTFRTILGQDILDTYLL